MLLTGQEIPAGAIDPERVVQTALRAGQMSVHHVRLAHASDAMAPAWRARRVGLALRVAGAHVQSARLPLGWPWPSVLLGGDTRDRATLVRGSYRRRGGHFDLEHLPGDDADGGDGSVDGPGKGPCPECWRSIARKALVVTRGVKLPLLWHRKLTPPIVRLFEWAWGVLTGGTATKMGDDREL
jgi:hypothetical protein